MEASAFYRSTAKAEAEIFYGQMKFCCKTAHFCDAHCKLTLLGVPIKSTLRNALRKRNYELPPVSNDMQSSATMRNSLGLNYNSAALSQLSDQCISAINRLRLDTSSLQKME